EDALARERLALSLGMDSWASLDALTSQHRRCVNGWFTKAVFGPVAEPGGDRVAAPGFDLESRPAQRQEALRASGYAQPEDIDQLLEQLRTSTYYRRLDDTGRRRLRELLGRLLPQLVQDAQPAITFA